MKKTTYYLFGTDAGKEYSENCFQDFYAKCEEFEFGFALFAFIEGETESVKLMEAFDGWGDYTIINQDEFELLQEL